jgi:hypothetical protein
MSTHNASGSQVPSVSGKLCQLIRRCDVAAALVGAGLLAISMGAFGGDPGAGHSTAMAPPSQPAPAGRRLIPAHPVYAPDFEPDLSAQRARIVDQLYEELMRRVRAECPSATNASIGSAC